MASTDKVDRPLSQLQEISTDNVQKPLPTLAIELYWQYQWTMTDTEHRPLLMPLLPKPYTFTDRYHRLYGQIITPILTKDLY